MQKKFLFTAQIKNDDFSSSGKLYLLGFDEYVFEGLPEDGIYLSLKKEQGKWVQTHGSPDFAFYVYQLGEQIEIFLDGGLTF